MTNSNHLYIQLALLANIAGQLNTLEFNEAWKAGEQGERAGLLADEELLTLPEGVVHSTLDENERFLFIVNHLGTINFVQETGDRIEDNTLTMLTFEGNKVVADVLETAPDGGVVSLLNLAAFFVFFGPEAVANQLQEVVRQLEGDAAVDAINVQAASAPEVMAEIRRISPKSADTLERMHGIATGDTCPDANRLMMMVREPRTIFLDTGWKKVGAVGVIGLAAYGLLRFCRG